jgi:hypothetical protein
MFWSEAFVYAGHAGFDGALGTPLAAKEVQY